jgi:hypothetical protein
MRIAEIFSVAAMCILNYQLSTVTYEINCVYNR